MFMVFDVDENWPGFYQKQVAGEESFGYEIFTPRKNSVFSWFIAGGGGTFCHALDI